MQKIGKYEVLQQLGVGASAIVYLGVDPFSKQHVAIKLFDLKALNDAKQAKLYHKLLMTEVALAGKLIHPHIVKIIDAVMDGGNNYVVMEYVKGGTLEQFAHTENLLPLDKIAEIIYKCCKALEYAQHHGVIHRDIKPANILLDDGTDIKITDFGAAVIQNQQTTQISGIGSPAYMSPEQIKENPLTHQSDIYSLGVVMYKLITGKLPFEATNNVSLMYHILNIDPLPVSVHRAEVPAEFEVIVQRAMARNAENRYLTWDQFATDLVGFFSGAALDRNEISDVEKFSMLRSLTFFKHFNDVELWEMLHISQWRKMTKGEFVLRDGNIGQSFYVLAQGSVVVLKHNRVLNQLQPGDCFGEMAHLSEQEFKRSTDVVAKEDVVLVEINPDVLVHASSGCRLMIGDAFLRMLVKRLSTANTRASQIKHKPERSKLNSGIKQLTVSELKTWLQRGGLRLLDVRTDDEVVRGKIPQGDSLPLHLIEMLLNEEDRTSPIAFYCQKGKNSANAARFAIDNGYTDVYILQGGISAWKKAGLPVAI